MIAHGLLLGLAFAVCGVGVLLGVIIPNRRIPALVAWIGSSAAVLMLVVSGSVLWSGRIFCFRLWTVRSVGTLTVSIDRLSALFLAVTAIVVLASSLFSASYLNRYVEHRGLRAFNAWYLLLFTSIALVLMADDALLFLLAWELMAIFSYLLVNFESERDDTSRAGYLMLAMGEAGFMAITLVFLFLAVKTGSLEFAALRMAGRGGLSNLAGWSVFLLAFLGFGVKAGLVPVNTWLPRAHPAAPANISAILSGAILNLGLYGFIRMILDLEPINLTGAGVTVLIIGTTSALVGILYASAEDDIKAMLAHSSVENIGIVTAGLGAGLIFRAYDKPVLAGMAFIAAFYHMMNHSAYKALLFLGAGTVNDRTGTRDLNKLGALIHRMPWTAGTFLVGSLAISALPPSNGFVSEWLTLQTMLRSAELPSIQVKIVFALCGAALALTAALAVTCFVKAFAMGFLGMSRSREAARAEEARASSLVPMVLLAAVCLLLGVLPSYVIPALSRELQPWTDAAADALVPPFFSADPGHGTLPHAFVDEFHDLGAQVGQSALPGRGLVVLLRGSADTPVVFAMSTAYMLVMLGLLLLLTYLVVRQWLTRGRQLARRGRWDGGVRRLQPEMTYTATGFSNSVRVIFDAVFRPTTIEDTRETVAEHFRIAIRRERTATHAVDRLVIQPSKAALIGLSRKLAIMHHGRVNAYAAYVLLALLLAMIVGLPH